VGVVTTDNENNQGGLSLPDVSVQSFALQLEAYSIEGAIFIKISKSWIAILGTSHHLTVN
jgi:hypothetical protein